MTQEEKGKAYEERLNTARHIYADPSVKEEDKYYIEVIFPELAESEDEKIRKEIIEFVKSRGGFKQEYIAWLEKQGEQAAAWSEEDERHRQWILECLVDGKRKVPEYAEDYQSAFDWLKSLKGKYTWKPSNEQMKRLKEACDEHYEIDGLDPLYTLYEDLKKLREE